MYMYVMCSHLNRHIEAILISTHNIPLSTWKRNKMNITRYYPNRIMFADIGFYGPKNEFEIAVVNEP